jgi:hypothetical protein
MAFTRTSAALKTAQLNAIVTAAGANATIKFYTGSAPANVDTAVTGTLLGTLTCASTLGTVSGSTLTFNAITGDTSVDATGAWGYARIATSAGAGVIDVDVGTTGTTIIMAAASAVQGASLDITSFTISQG